MNVAIFASGGGSNFQALLDKQLEGSLSVNFVACVGNNSNAKAFDRAKKNGIPTFHIAPSHFPTSEAYVVELSRILREQKVEYIVLAGYMKMIPQEIIRAFPYRIINIHPALLPSFGGQGMYGMHVHDAVIAYGAKISGITIHFVNEEYDRGAIIYQASLPVLDHYTAQDLAQAVLSLEHDSLWRVLEGLAKQHIFVAEGKVYGSF